MTRRFSVKLESFPAISAFFGTDLIHADRSTFMISSYARECFQGGLPVAPRGAARGRFVAEALSMADTTLAIGNGQLTFESALELKSKQS